MKTKKRVFHKNKRRVQRKRIWQRIIRRLKRKHHQRGSRHAFRRYSNRRQTSKKSRSRDILLPDYGISSSTTTSTPQSPISSSTTQINNAVNNSLYPSEVWDFGNGAIATPLTPTCCENDNCSQHANAFLPDGIPPLTANNNGGQSVKVVVVHNSNRWRTLYQWWEAQIEFALGNQKKYNHYGIVAHQHTELREILEKIGVVFDRNDLVRKAYRQMQHAIPNIGKSEQAISSSNEAKNVLQSMLGDVTDLL